MAVWGGAALLLLLPAVAMRFTAEVDWSAEDFITFGVMLFAACGTWELAARRTGSTAYRAAVAISVVAAFLLVWINLAVGIIGSEDNAANLMFVGVLAIGAIGAVVSRFRPGGMVRVMTVTAFAQALAGVVALIAGWGQILPITAVFVAFWLSSAWLFRKAQHSPPRGAA